MYLNSFRNISLRISAIRETFEELGLLICKTKNAIALQEKNDDIPFASTVEKNVKYWQTEVKC